MQRDKKKIRSILLELKNDRGTAYSSQRAGEAGLALVRLVEGTYGVCVDCDKNIPEARLREQPEAPRCVECQSASERPLVSSS
jgi:RNA polymerase-binding transcription factor DksA